MRKFEHYNFKKIYLDEEIFQLAGNEIKIGYLNINGLLNAGHAEYLDADRNLLNIDILTLSETKLTKNVKSEQIIRRMDNWNIFRRYDSKDGMGHMGLMILTSKKSNVTKEIYSMTQRWYERYEKLQIEGLIITMKDGRNYGFIYSRSTPTNSEISHICRDFNSCNILMGDFNLSHRNADDQVKVTTLCQGNKINALKEITRPVSNNQLDYIFIDETMKNNSFATSYNNFISDHKSIVVRVGSEGNELTNATKEKIHFNLELHLKSQKMQIIENSEDKLGLSCAKLSSSWLQAYSASD